MSASATGLSYRPRLLRLAEFCAAATLTDFDPTSIERAKLVIADTVGVAIAGSLETEQGVLAGRDLEAGTSSVLMPGFPTTSSSWAAFLNATAASFLELDQGARPTGHPAIHILPLTLAEAQALDVSGVDLLTAFLVGYEVQGRIQSAFKLRWPVHPHGNLGHPGAAAALARLRGWDAGRIVDVIETAASFASATSWGSCFDGATTRNAFAGLSAGSALTAVSLLESGFTAPSSALGDTFGVILGDGLDLEALVRGLGSSAEIDRSYFKFHAACALSHPSLDATAQALGAELRHGAYPLHVVAPARRLDPEQVRRIVVVVPDRAGKLDRNPSGTSLAAKFSIPYAVAALVVGGSSGPEAFRDPLLHHPAVNDLARRVVVQVDPEMTAAWPERAQARVLIEVSDGSVMEGRCDNPYGSSDTPASVQNLAAKFDVLTAPLPAAERAELWTRLLTLELLRPRAVFTSLA